MAEKEEAIEIEGVITEALKGKFRIQIDKAKPEDPTIEVLGYIGGKLRTHNIKMVIGDRVKVEVSPYDLTRGRITYRLKG